MSLEFSFLSRLPGYRLCFGLSWSSWLWRFWWHICLPHSNLHLTPQVLSRPPELISGDSSGQWEGEREKREMRKERTATSATVWVQQRNLCLDWLNKGEQEWVVSESESSCPATDSVIGYCKQVYPRLAAHCCWSGAARWTERRQSSDNCNCLNWQTWTRVQNECSH